MSDVSVALTQATTAIGAIGGLGLAASGLVDASKVFFGGGISKVGFPKIEAALLPFKPALDGAQTDWTDTIRANWINGVSKEDQKAAAKSLIRLGLSSVNADLMATAGHVDGAKLKAVVKAIETGAALKPEQVTLLGRFNGAIDAALDGGFEQADQKYRNAAKLASGAVAVVLAIAAAKLLSGVPWGDYLLSIAFWRAALIGVISVPLAPVAKDLTSSLQAAAGALKAAKA